jgi:hypothetical protein
MGIVKTLVEEMSWGITVQSGVDDRLTDMILIDLSIFEFKPENY